jgi:hypothetical protein
MAIYKHVMSGPGAAGDVWTVGLHSSGVGTLAAAHSAFQAFITSLTGPSAIGPVWTLATQIQELVSYTLNPATGRATAKVQSSVSVGGTSTGGQPDPRSCVVVGLRSTVPGPSGRGRMYFPAPSLDNLTADGLIEEACRTTIAGSIAAGLGDMGGSGFVPVVWSVSNPAGSPIQSVTVSQVPGTQRSRSNKIPNAYTIANIA